MALVKLNITPLARSRIAPIEVQFNPNSYTIVKAVTWAPLTASSQSPKNSNRELNASPLQFGGGTARTLTLQLFFDVTESVDTRDVRSKTNRIVELTRIERDQQRPPVCLLTWGSAPTGSDFPFKGVLTNLSQSFTLFRETGEPLRATLTVTFTEFLDPEDDKRETDPELTTYVVKRGDTLSGIAAQFYRDPALWRLIAQANGIDNPLRPPIGSQLRIPKA